MTLDLITIPIDDAVSLPTAAYNRNPADLHSRRQIINRLVENEVRTLRDDFLAYHQATLSSYRGMRGPVVETEDYPSTDACTRAVSRGFRR